MRKKTILLSLALIFTLVACGEKKEETSNPETAKPAEQAATPANSTPEAASTAQASAAGDHPGKAIHDANCISCHDAGVYTRADRKMQDFSMLSAQVRRCDANLGSKLFDEDMDKVTDFLNEAYYHFPKQ